MTSALPIHPRTGLAALAVFGSRPVWPILGGAPDDPPAGPGEQPPSGDAPPAGDEGFPKGTPVADMQPTEQAAYWRSEAKKQQKRADERKDYDTLRKERDDLKAAHQTESEKALEAARGEGRSAAMAEVNREAVSAILESSLRLRGYDDDRVSSTVKYVNPDAFVADGRVDVAGIASYVESIAGPGTGQGRTPDFGAGQRGGTSRASGAAAGLAEAERRGFVKRTS